MSESRIEQRLTWCLLLLAVFYTAGSFVFVSLERGAELERYDVNRDLYEKMKDMYSFSHCSDPAFKGLSFCQNQQEFTDALGEYFNKHGNSITDEERWTYLGTVFFLTHLGTTIGYGNSHPHTSGGQLATIVFAFLGVPIMGYTLAVVAQLDLLAAVFVLERVLRRPFQSSMAKVAVLWVLLLVFLCCGALVYRYLEGWTFLESLYFCFVTLATVGFGDFLPSTAISKVFSIFYIIFGLGVCASIIAVLTGLVAESHEDVDDFVRSKFRDQCSQICAARPEPEDRSP